MQHEFNIKNLLEAFFEMVAEKDYEIFAKETEIKELKQKISELSSEIKELKLKQITEN